MAERIPANLKCNNIECGHKFRGRAWAEWVEGQRMGRWVRSERGAADACPACGSKSVKTLELIY